MLIDPTGDQLVFVMLFEQQRRMIGAPTTTRMPMTMAMTAMTTPMTMMPMTMAMTATTTPMTRQMRPAD